jgi:hypothetical protein
VKQRGRAWLVVLVAVAAAAGAVWYFFPEEVRKVTVEAERALEPGPTITPIRDIAAAPRRFDGKEVTVQGVVTSTSELVASSGQASRFYTLRGDGAEVVVTVRDSLPARGQSLTVTGVVAEGPPGKGVAPRLAEKRRERSGGG